MQFKNQLSTCKNEARQGKEDVVTRTPKRAKNEKLYSYKGKRNDKQAKIDASTDEVLAEVKLDLSEPRTLPVLKLICNATKWHYKLIWK